MFIMNRDSLYKAKTELVIIPRNEKHQEYNQ